MTIGEIVGLFNAKRAGKGKYTAKCPSHDDRSRNTLSIKEGTRGVLIHCWAGCPKEAVLASAGLSFSDLFYTSRDLPSAKLKEIYRQQHLDRLYQREQRMQDLRMMLNAVAIPPHRRLIRTKSRFEVDIENYANRFGK